jgi:hypothetical protein
MLIAIFKLIFIAMTNERKYQNKIIECCVKDYSATTAEIFQSSKARTPLGQQVFRLVCRASHKRYLRAGFLSDGRDDSVRGANQHTCYTVCIFVLLLSLLFVLICFPEQEFSVTISQETLHTFLCADYFCVRTVFFF